MDEIIAAINAAREIQAQRQAQLRQQAQAQRAPQPAPQQAPAPAQPAAAAENASSDEVAPPSLVDSAPELVREHVVRPTALQGMFANGNTLLRAVVASEVLRKPIALQENERWSLLPNEPST